MDCDLDTATPTAPQNSQRRVGALAEICNSTGFEHDEQKMEAYSRWQSQSKKRLVGEKASLYILFIDLWKLIKYVGSTLNVITNARCQATIDPESSTFHGSYSYFENQMDLIEFSLLTAAPTIDDDDADGQWWWSWWE